MLSFWSLLLGATLEKENKKVEKDTIPSLKIWNSNIQSFTASYFIEVKTSHKLKNPKTEIKTF